MCHERLAFGGTHPPDFQEFVLQNTSFPFGVRASGHRFPCPGGTSFRDTAPGELRETVSRNASFAGETSVLGQQNLMSPEGLAFGGPHARTFGSPCHGIQVSHPGGTGSVEADSNTSPPPRPRDQTGTLAALRKGN